MRALGPLLFLFITWVSLYLMRVSLSTIKEAEQALWTWTRSVGGRGLRRPGRRTGDIGTFGAVLLRAGAWRHGNRFPSQSAAAQAARPGKACSPHCRAWVVCRGRRAGSSRPTPFSVGAAYMPPLPRPKRARADTEVGPYGCRCNSLRRGGPPCPPAPPVLGSPMRGAISEAD